MYQCAECRVSPNREFLLQGIRCYGGFVREGMREERQPGIPRIVSVSNLPEGYIRAKEASMQ